LVIRLFVGTVGRSSRKTAKIAKQINQAFTYRYLAVVIPNNIAFAVHLPNNSVVFRIKMPFISKTTP
jgi:hypothetical protein